MGNIEPNVSNNIMPYIGVLVGLSGLGMSDLNAQMGQQLSNPMFMQMMQNFLQNPEMIQMALNNPQMQELAQSDPQIQAFLNNPLFMQILLNPQNLQMMSNIFRGMAIRQNIISNQSNASGTGNNQNPFGSNLAQMQQLLGGMQGLGGLAGLGGLGTNNAGGTGGTGNLGNLGNMGTGENDPNVDYKEKYKEQLAQLKEMGYFNEETNLQILKQCSGNVHFAVERLINKLG